MPEGVHVHDAPPTMAAALDPTRGLSVVGGVINLPGSLTLEHFLEHVLGEPTFPKDSRLAPGGAALLVAVAGIFCARLLYLTRARHVRGGASSAARPLSSARLGTSSTSTRSTAGVIVLPGKRFAVFCRRRHRYASVIDGFVNGVGRVVAGWPRRCADSRRDTSATTRSRSFSASSSSSRCCSCEWGP